MAQFNVGDAVVRLPDYYGNPQPGSKNWPFGGEVFKVADRSGSTVCLQDLSGRSIDIWDTDKFELYDPMKGIHITKCEPLSAPVPGSGVKFDSAKPRMDLLPPELLFGVSDILAFGAAKYSDRNWETGMKWSRVFGALMRHMWAWWGGEHNDPETGKSHLWHAGCCIAFLIAYEQRKIGTDDRPLPLT